MDQKSLKGDTMASSPLLTAFKEAIMDVVELVVKLIDLVLLPVYFLIFRPDKRRQQRSLGDFAVPPYRQISDDMVEMADNWHHGLETVRKLPELPQYRNIYDIFEMRYRRDPNSPCMGVRPVLGTVANDGPKLVLGDEFRWETYGQVRIRVGSIASGLRRLGAMEKGDKVVICAPTCQEWMLASLACARNSYVLVTMYDTLGLESMKTIVSKTKAKVLIVNQEKLGAVMDLLVADEGLLGHGVKAVVYIPGRNMTEAGHQSHSKAFSGKVLAFAGLEDAAADGGQDDQAPAYHADPDDLAVIMYTSGSTGDPKGVMLTHGNLICTVRSITSCVLTCLYSTGSYKRRPQPAYLPLSHIFEFSLELVNISMGAPIGYSSPATLTNQSPGVGPGQQGDLALLRPEAVIMVPLMAERLQRSILNSVRAKGPVFEAVFERCLRYKARWSEDLGYPTPLLDAIVFKKIRDLMGGELKLLTVGGAPFDPKVDLFLRLTLGAKILVAYGLTECGVSSANAVEIRPGTVGLKLNFDKGVRLALKDWPEGGYTIRDEGGPRGEVVVSGPHLFQGYFMCDSEADNNALWWMDERVSSEDGGDDDAAGPDVGGMSSASRSRWFSTGDIGHLNHQGSLSIVDRKKDLVKLQMGEYVALGKVEATIKAWPFVENACVHADPMRTFVVAIVVANEANLSQLLKANLEATAAVTNGTTAEPLRNGAGSRKMSPAELCGNDAIVRLFHTEMVRFLSKKLARFEIPMKITLTADVWNAESGLVTPTLKVKRKAVYAKYQRDIESMYA